MKAFVLSKFGSPQNLQLKEVPRPKPASDEVLIRVRATTVNDYDWSMVTGRPYAYRLLFGIFKPRRPIPGMELSGSIEQVGADVKSFAVGDRVCGDTSDHGFGTFAQFIAINPRALVNMPDALSFEDAAALPHASLLAKQALDIAGVKDGDKVLINGAGGGMGTFALQLLKGRDIHITGVDTGEKLDMMQALGFDRVLDYKETDFTRTGEQYNVVLDAKSNRPPRSYARSLVSGGIYVTVGGTPRRLIQLLFRKRIGSKRLCILSLKANRGLEEMTALCAQGSIRPVLDGPHPFATIPTLVQRFGEGKHYGKVVIRVE